MKKFEPFFFFKIIMVSLISQHSLLHYHLVFPIVWQIKMVCFEKSGKNFVMLLRGEMKTLVVDRRTEG